MGKKLLFHLAYWVLAWCLTNLMFGYEGLFNPYSLLYSSVLLLIAAGVSYWIVYFLIPRYLVHDKHGRFLTYLVFTVIVSLDLELLTTMVFIIFFERFQVMVFFHSSREIYSLMTGTYFIVFLSVGIKLVEYWYREQKRKQVAMKEKVETELKLLKSQIHPHFLFNTLNNIYSLAMQKSDRAPDAVLKLSELLDYLIYQGEADEVSLEKEIHFIRNYLELENLRYGDRLEADFQVKGNPEGIRIAPFLLIPLVENSFKHGLSQGRKNQRLTIKLEISGRNMEFYIENTVPENTGGEKPAGGMGLVNLRKRLELLYGGHYSLETRNEGARYAALLKLRT
jgi:sensor histidine kinase YesM